MYFHEHLRLTFEELKKQDYTYYHANVRTIVPLVAEITKWFDEFANRQGVDSKGKAYDYSPSESAQEFFRRIAHREQRHHYSGLVECESIFTPRYSKEFQNLISRIAKQHVLADMGYIPNEEEYKERNFWINWQRKVYDGELKISWWCPRC